MYSNILASGICREKGRSYNVTKSIFTILEIYTGIFI